MKQLRRASLAALLVASAWLGGCGRRAGERAGESGGAGREWPVSLCCSGVQVRARAAADNVIEFDCRLADARAPATAAAQTPLIAGTNTFLVADPPSGSLTLVFEGRAVWRGSVRPLKTAAGERTPGLAVTWDARAGEYLCGAGEGTVSLRRYDRQTGVGTLTAGGGEERVKRRLAEAVVYCTDGFAVLFRGRSGGRFDLEAADEEGFLACQSDGANIAFVVAAGRTLSELVTRIARAQAPVRALPEWACAPWVRDDGCRNHDTVYEMVAALLARGLPVAAVRHEADPTATRWAAVGPEAEAAIEEHRATARRHGVREASRATVLPGLKESAVWWLDVGDPHGVPMDEVMARVISASLSGYPFWGLSVADSPAGTGDMLVRRLQLAAFSPLMERHVVGSPGSAAEEDEAEEAFRRLTALRMNLKPLFAILGREVERSGLPVTRPMMLQFPRSSACANDTSSSQYMLGADVLVAPVLEAARAGRLVAFPPGVWHCALQSVAYAGPGVYAVPISLADAPLFFREGADIPVQLARDGRLGEWTPRAPERTLRIAPERSVIRGLETPLEGNPLHRDARLRFQVSPDFAGSLAGCWFFSDAPDQPYDVEVRVEGGTAVMDLTPPPEFELAGKTQVYVIRGRRGTEPAGDLLRGELPWRSPLRIEPNPPRLTAVAGEKRRIVTRLRNASAEPLDVRLAARVLGRGLRPNPPAQTVAVPAAGSCDAEWEVAALPDNEVGDAMIAFSAESAGTGLGAVALPVSRGPRWVVAGPFAAPPGMAARIPFAPEWEQAAAAIFVAPGTTCRWEQATSPRKAGDLALDFARMFGFLHAGCAYALTRIYSDAERTVEIRVGGDDLVSVWVNGSRVFDAAPDEGREAGAVVATARLRQGINTLVVKVCQEQGPWELDVRLTALDEKPAQGLKDGFTDYAHYEGDRAAGRVVPAEVRPLDWQVWAMPGSGQVLPANVTERAEKMAVAAQWPPPVEGGQWQRVAPENCAGNVFDLRALAAAAPAAPVVCLAATIQAGESEAARVVCTPGRGVALWFNGRRVAPPPEAEVFSAKIAREFGRVRLQAGQNRLLCVVARDPEDARFQCNLYDPSVTPAVPLAGRGNGE